MVENDANLNQPTLASLFVDYEPEIRSIFAQTVLESELVGDRAPQLEFTDTGTTMLFRSVPSERLVRADWRGIASLWAMSQAVGRLSPAMFTARRIEAGRLDLVEGSAEELGYQFIGYAKQLAVPQQWLWNSFFPTPKRRPSCDFAKTGDSFFLLCIEWILRHEIGHIALNHCDETWSAEQSRVEERDADRYATRGIKGYCAADADRAPGTQPSEEELELERRALAAGLGLVWVSIYEDSRGQPSDFYPPVSDRMFRCLAEFGLAVDSAALEILSDFIKAWIDPETIWPAKPGEEATAQAAMDEACSQLDAYARNARG